MQAGQATIRVVLALVLALASPAAALAEAPGQTIRPMARPALTSDPVRRPPDPSRVAALRADRATQPEPAAAVAQTETVEPASAPAPETSPAITAAAPVFAHPDPGFAALQPPSPRAAAQGTWADTDGATLRPRQRPGTAAVSTATATPSLGARLVAALRPEPRPSRQRAPEQVEPAAVIRPAPGTGPLVSRRGSVCGVNGIKGETIAPIVGRVRGCGVANPVRITSVDGVQLSQAAIMDCDTARALQAWVQKGLQPAFRGEVTALQVAGHYVCRTRNHKRGARLSEHSKGKAIDISGLTLANGTRLSIQRDWRGRHGKALKAAHRAACGPFGTTLGPGSDGMHEDHLHFDTARHRNGPYCR